MDLASHWYGARPDRNWDIVLLQAASNTSPQLLPSIVGGLFIW